MFFKVEFFHLVRSQKKNLPWSNVDIPDNNQQVLLFSTTNFQ